MTLIGAFLDWLGGGNAFDIPIAFLWDPRSSFGVKIRVGYALLAVAALLLVVAAKPHLRSRTRLLGTVLVAVAGVFIVQVWRYDGEFEFGSYGTGVWATAAAGLFAFRLGREAPGKGLSNAD